MITCGEIIDANAKSYNEETKTEIIWNNEIIAICETTNLYVLLAIFLLTTIILLIAVSIYCYLIKHWAKQKHLLPFHVTNNKLTI